MLTLTFEFLAPWHCGAGHGRGAGADLTVVRDADGLPFVPGRTVKGLVRHAVQCLEDWGHAASGVTSILFGSAPGSADGRRTDPGCLIFDDAAMDIAVRSWLVGGDSETAATRAQLFREYQSTAIDQDTGTAQHRTLRVIEVAVPMILQAGVTFRPEALAQGSDVSGFDPAAQWQDVLTRAAPLVTAAGAFRTRGFGRVTVSTSGNKGA